MVYRSRTQGDAGKKRLKLKKVHSERKEIMNNVVAWLTGAGIGASLMYVFDPARGNRRRALVRDQISRSWHKTEDLLDKASRDLQNRTQGMIAATKSRFSGEAVSDQVLAERVRAEMGRVVSHPSAISVTVEQGYVSLTGPILADEVDRLLKTVNKIRGVTAVENLLEVHQQPGDVPGLQGQAAPREPRFELFQENWTPVLRVLAALAGGLVTLLGLRRGGLTGTAGSVIGLGLMARGVANMPVKRLVGVDTGRRAIDLQKTVNVDAPVEEVFKFWQNYENLPRFMANVEEVRDMGDGHSHWVVKGPANTTLEWEARITSLVPNKVLAWRSLPGSVVGHAGIINFEPNQRGGTQVDVKLSYRPPAGAMGHLAASLFGHNPKQMMNEDLARFKSLIEQGKTTAGDQQVMREEPSFY
jgi:uncharacterized membrane protein